MNRLISKDDLMSAEKLHLELFPEEYDFHYDSSVEAKERRRGKNPMSKEYTDFVNARRLSYDVTPLGVNGLPINSSSMQYCLNRIRQSGDRND